MKDEKSAKIFLKNYLDLCATHHETGRAVLVKLGIAPSAIGNWRKGAMPNVNTMRKIAEYFNVSINTLAGITEEGVTDYHLSPVSEEIERIVYAYRRASTEDREIVKMVLKKYEAD